MEDNLENQSTGATGDELSHSDKMIGIFSEPAQTYDVINKFPPRTIDWLLPVVILLLFVSLTQLIVMSNEEIAFQVKQKTLTQMEKNFSEMVEKGHMTREEADKQIDRIMDQMESGKGVLGFVLQTVSILFFGFFVFFIVVTIHFIFVKLILKGEGSYASALVANGLPAYISIIMVVLSAILSLAFGRMMTDVSVASLVNADKLSYLGFILGKIDPISIWVYTIVSIGLAKMNNSESYGGYFGIVFGVWIIGSFLIFLVAKAVPFLGFLVGQ